MRLKRGAVDIQFNWVFVLIVGAVILILFTGVILKEKNISNASRNALMLENLDIILSSSEISRGTANVVKIPKTKIEFGCNRYAIGEVSKQINTMPFAPMLLESDKVVTMALGWEVPYRATNLVYLTNPSIRYIFVGDSIFARNIYEMMPDEIRNDGYTNVQAIQDENDDMVRIIFFGQNPEPPGSLKETNSKITALKVDGNENKGTLEFFDLVDDEFESRGISYYLKESTLFGAIFTDNIEIYNCVMENSFKKLNVISQVYKKKINDLHEYYLNKSDSCKDYFFGARIQKILDASSEFSQSSINNIDAAAEDLEEQNKHLQEKSCALIY